MTSVITEQAILDALRHVPQERWGQVRSYLDSLRPPAPPIRTAADLLTSEFVGVWADRDDIDDAREFAGRLRYEAERRGTGDDAPGH